MELKGHTDSVDQLCWDPKHADLLATASGDKTVRLWDARSEYYSMYSLALPTSFSFIRHSILPELFCCPLVGSLEWKQGGFLMDMLVAAGKCSQQVELSGENINITYKPDGSHIAVGNRVSSYNVHVHSFFIYTFISLDQENL